MTDRTDPSGAPPGPDRLAAEVAAQVRDWPWAETVTLKATGGSQQAKRRWAVLAATATEPVNRMTYGICACGGTFRVEPNGQRVPCPYCGGTLTRDEAEESARYMAAYVPALMAANGWNAEETNEVEAAAKEAQRG